jgi:hypothetical protein
VLAFGFRVIRTGPAFCSFFDATPMGHIDDVLKAWRRGPGD